MLQSYQLSKTARFLTHPVLITVCAVARPTVNGDRICQLKMAIFDPNKINPVLTDGQIFVIGETTTPVPNLVEIRSRGSFTGIRKTRRWIFFRAGWFKRRGIAQGCAILGIIDIFHNFWDQSAKKTFFWA